MDRNSISFLSNFANRTEIAKRAQMSVSYVSRIGIGERKPRPPMARRLAEVLGMNIDHLYYEIERTRKANRVRRGAGMARVLTMKLRGRGVIV
jgi:transcriptional regulator with XRE-family HTH domain